MGVLSREYVSVLSMEEYNGMEKGAVIDRASQQVGVKLNNG